MNALTKYVILNIAELILKYTHFAGVLNHKIKSEIKNIKHVTVNKETHEIIIASESQLIGIINQSSYNIEYYDLYNLNIFNNFHYIKIQMIFILHEQTYIHIKISERNIKTDYIINFSKLKISIGLNKKSTKKYLELSDNESDNESVSDEKENNICNVPDDAYIILNECIVSYTPDQNTIVCGFDNKIIRFYDVKTLTKKSCIIDFDMNTKKLYDYYNDKINQLLFLDNFLVISTNKLYVYELCSDEYIFKTYISADEHIPNSICLLSNNLLYSDQSGSHIYNLITNSTKLFDSDHHSCFSYVRYVIGSKIIVEYRSCIVIYTHNIFWKKQDDNFCLKKYITIHGKYKIIKLLSDMRLLLCSDDHTKIININSGKVINNSALKYTIDDYNIDELYYIDEKIIPAYNAQSKKKQKLRKQKYFSDADEYDNKSSKKQPTENLCELIEIWI
jgi:hypothetical protein